jgi:hypothetical protein
MVPALMAPTYATLEPAERARLARLLAVRANEYDGTADAPRRRKQTGADVEAVAAGRRLTTKRLCALLGDLEQVYRVAEHHGEHREAVAELAWLRALRERACPP